jgi:hypothetical protein
MDQVTGTEVWRQIPPEEKLALMARAQATGTMTCIIVILVGCTLAVALKYPALMWGSFILIPLFFQFAAGKAWRDLRPRMMLEYLAARSAARRYAYTANAKDLSVSLMFRGYMETTSSTPKEEDEDTDYANAVRSDTKNIWAALFPDTLIIMSEKPGGAKCDFAVNLGEKCAVEGKSLDDEGDYSSNREVLITLGPDRGRPGTKLKITSDFPAALVVFEKLLQKNIEIAKLAKEKEIESIAHTGSVF